MRPQRRAGWVGAGAGCGVRARAGGADATRARAVSSRRVLGQCLRGGAPCERVDQVQAVDEGALKARWVARSRVVSRQRGCAFAGELHEGNGASSIDNGRIKLCVLKNWPQEAYLAAEKKCGQAAEICGSGAQRKSGIATHLLVRKC